MGMRVTTLDTELSIVDGPAQVFTLLDDSKRSSKFCIACPLYGLRGMLGITDVEELAASTARTIQVSFHDNVAVPLRLLLSQVSHRVCCEQLNVAGRLAST